MYDALLGAADGKTDKTFAFACDVDASGGGAREVGLGGGAKGIAREYFVV